jgi:predicted O-methyltransferase YrrM
VDAPAASAPVNVRGYRAGSRAPVPPARLPPWDILHNARPTRAGRTGGEAAISITAGTLAYLDEFFPEDDALIGAKRNAAEVGGAAPVSPTTGGALRFMAAAVGARSVVEVGTGCGASGIWLLRGMRPGAVLTSVDVEAEHQRLARAAFLAAGFPAARYRLIGGLALEVLPRLADGAYDMVFCDADRQEFTDYLVAALRLLRPGGIVIFNAALPGTAAGERIPTDSEAAAAASLREQVRADERLVPLLLPVGNGLLAAVKQP